MRTPLATFALRVRCECLIPPRRDAVCTPKIRTKLYQRMRGQMIHGSKVLRPSKSEIAADIASLLNLAPSTVNRGASFDSYFFGTVYEALSGATAGDSNPYRRVEAVLAELGLPYDPYWDTNEAAVSGSATVAIRAYSRIRAELSGVPRCFLLNVTDAPVGNQWEIDHSRAYKYGPNVTAHRPMNEAGPGSRVVFYSTSKSSENKMSYVATARVRHVAALLDGQWEAQFSHYAEFPSPVPRRELDLPRYNTQHAITEISLATLDSLILAGGLRELDQLTSAEEDESFVRRREVEETTAQLNKDFPFSFGDIEVEIPVELPRGEFESPAGLVPDYRDDGDTVRISGAALHGGHGSNNRAADVVAERRAVAIVRAGLESTGWLLERDCQADGKGYDLEFRQSGRRLKVEVKGIQGQKLVFNLTPKEVWRAQTDPDWVLVAVTSVLSPAEFKVNVVTRDRIATGEKQILGYRMLA